jgi:hypothetical protein
MITAILFIAALAYVIFGIGLVLVIVVAPRERER